MGSTTNQLNQFVHNQIIVNNAYPSPLRYHKYPKSITVSPNNVMCHGLPSDRPFVDGDILTVDVAVSSFVPTRQNPMNSKLIDFWFFVFQIFANGVHASCARTFGIGNVKSRHVNMAITAELCTDEAIKVCGPGVPFSEIGKTIEKIADMYDFRVVEEFVGHGIGTFYEGPPMIYHNSKQLS